jgi:Mn-dependent DtxR family transcriptional regulator
MGSNDEKEMSLYTEKEGQYLAFIFYYKKINGVSPAQIDLQRYFSVTPPTVHNMILKLERKKLINRVSNAPRSLTINLMESELPRLL